jgi:hypothetical protein
LKTESGALCCRPHLSAPRQPPHCAAPRHTQLLTTGPPSCPGPPVRHVDPHRADPAALHCHAATRRPLVPRPGRCHPSLPLSLPLRLQAVPTALSPPSPPLPLKHSHHPPAILFLPRVPFILSAHARAPHMLPPSPRCPPHQFATTGAPPPRRTPSEHRRRPPPSGERPLSCTIPQSVAASSPCWSPSSCRTSPRWSTTTRATPPPLITAARRRLHRLTVGMPFRCAPALSSLPGTSRVAPSRSPATPYRHRATAEPQTSVPLCHPMRGLRVVTTPARARVAAGHAGRFPHWAEPLGHGLAAVSADHVWQAAVPRGL